MTRQVRVGVQLPEIERVVRWDEVASMALRAESTGFDSVWLGDHLLYEMDGQRRGPWEAWTQLAAIAAMTRRVTLGPLVAAVPFHPPAVLAKMAASVDEISGGRLVLGLGAGWNRTEFAAFGLPYDARVTRFLEGFEIIRRMNEGERVAFDGAYHQVDGAELLPPPRRRIPLMIGSNGPRMLEHTLPHVDAWNTWFEDYGNDPARIRDVVDRVRDVCRHVGRDPSEIELTAAHLVGFGHGEPRRAATNPTPGEPRRIAEAIGRLAEAGIGHVQLVLDPITEDTIARVSESLELI